MLQVYTNLSDYVIPFLGLIAASSLIFYKANFAPVFGKIYQFVQNRGLAENQNLNSELVKINLLRILLGLILFHRTFYIAYYQFYLDATSSSFYLSLTVLLCAGCVIIGFLTPVATTFLLLFNIPIDNMMKTVTLGTDVLQMMIMVFCLLPAGTHLSLDSRLRKRAYIGPVIRSLYQCFGVPTLEKIAILKLLLILTYGSLCIYSVTMHFDDIAWLSGNANLLVVTSSYLGKHYPFFREWSQASPEIAVIASKFSIYGMMVWELFLIPLLLWNRITRNVAIFWGLVFFVVSTFILQLGWLSYYEFVLWGLLFWQCHGLNPKANTCFKLIYDDKCNLCDKTLYFIQKVDLFGVIKETPLSVNQEILSKYGISRENAYQDLYGIDPQGRIFKGYSLYLELTKRVLLLHPLFPILYLGKFYIGPFLYRLIANNRIRVFGSCSVPSVKSTSNNEGDGLRAKAEIRDNQWLLKAFLPVFLICILSYFVRMPIVQQLIGYKPANYSAPIRKAMNEFGMNVINVFNYHDLHLNNSFFTVSRYDGSHWSLLPFTGKEGERLKWHQSDRMYFANSLLWRRSNLDGHNYCDLTELDTNSLSELIKLDTNLNHLDKQKLKYRVDYYYQPLPTIHTQKNYSVEFHKINHHCTIYVEPQRLAVLKKTVHA